MSLTIPPYIPPVTPADKLNGQREISRQAKTIAAAGTTIPIVYGEAQVGGRIFAATFTGGFWYVGAVFCVGQIDSFTALYLNGVDVKPATPAGMSINYYTGTTSQTADALLASAISGYTDTLIVSNAGGSVGLAYVVLKYSEAHYSGFPTILAKVKGRKVRPLSENLIEDSEDLNGTGWTVFNAARTVNATTAPDQATTADKLDETAITAQHHTQTPTVSGLQDNVRCVFSVFLKAAERTCARIGIIDKTNSSNTATIDLTTGEVLNNTGTNYVDSGCVSYGGGWYRAWVVSSVGTGATVPRGRVWIMQDASNVVTTGVAGSGIYVWGAQFEQKESPGIYSPTSATASAAAWSDNPGLCARDLIANPVFGLGEDVDDLSVLCVDNECDALVTSEKRRTLNLVIDSQRSATDWIDTLATYCGAWIFKAGGRWTFKPDRPAKLWRFRSSTNGWTVTNGTGVTWPDTWQLTQTAADLYVTSPSGLNICGSQARFVRIKLMRNSGTGTLTLYCYYRNSNHTFFGNSWRASKSWTFGNNGWVTIEFDMHNLTAGGDEWKQSIIDYIRIDLTQSVATDVWSIDWVSVGVDPITTDSVVAGSFSAGTADASQIPTVIRLDYTDTSTTEYKTRPAYAESVGVSTGDLPRRESTIAMPGVTRYSQAYREAAERLAKLNNSLYCEFTRFDEGLATEVGDVLSVMHPYVGTASDTETTETTLFLVTDAKTIAPGRVRVRATKYEYGDYDNSENTTTWGEYTRRAGNLGGSGDGINRIQPRFAGGFATVDFDGQFPVTKGANILYASATAGSAPDPTAGYYGAYALKIGTEASGTARTVWFGSSTTDYTMPIDANSKWLFSCKFWPSSASNTSVTFTLKSSAGTSYTLTDTTSTISTWNDFVDTASGSNLLNLVNDSSETAIFALAVNRTSSYVWFDGLMLEKQVGEGATTSPWKPPLASATNPARITPRLVSPGILDKAVSIDDGNGNSRTITAGAYTSTATDGQSITFSPAFLRVPAVQFSPAALTYSTGAGFGSTNNQTLVCEARDLTASGFTAYLKVRTTATTVTTTTDTTPTDAGALAVPRYLIQKSSASQAWDDRYTFTFDVTVKNIVDFEPATSSYLPGSVTVGIYIATADSGSPNFTPTWTKVASVSVPGGAGSATTSRTGRTVTVTRDGLTQRGGTTAEFGIAIEAQTVPGGALTFTNVKYDLAVTAPTETSATAAGVAPVPFTVIPQ